MKKLMFVAATAAMVGGAFAASCDPLNPENPLCESIGFKFTASGKMACPVKDAEYKTVQALKVSKGALLITARATQDCTTGPSTSVTEAKESKIVIAEVLGQANDTSAYLNGGYNYLATGYEWANNGASFDDVSVKPAYNGTPVAWNVVASTNALGQFEFPVDSEARKFRLEITSRNISNTGFDTVYDYKVYAVYTQDVTTTTPGEQTCGETYCCYDTVKLFLNGKVGKTAFKFVIEDALLNKWSIFGKNLEKAIDLDLVKEGKSYSVETDLGFEALGSTDASLEDDPLLDDFYFMASGFGKMNVKWSKYKKTDSDCGMPTVVNGCEPEFVYKNYSGWFAGYYAAASSYYDEPLTDQNFLATTECDPCVNYIFGGTWKATFNKNIKDEASAASAAGVAY